MAASQSVQPGILHVTMQPKPSLLPAQFHDWYNNEHGPGRLRYPFFLNGFRYRATDLPSAGDAYGAADSSSGSKELPEWMAIYDVTDMAEMLKSPYIDLRKSPKQSQRERDTMKEIFVDRRFYDLVSTEQSTSFRKFEDVAAEGEGNVMAAISFVLSSADKLADWEKWYTENDLPAVKEMPGWQRTRRFKTASVDNRDEEEVLLLHEFTPDSGFSSKEKFLEASSKSWEHLSTVAKSKILRTYELYYTFGPAPRELKALETKDYTTSYELPDNRTRTFNKTQTGTTSGAVESYITTADGVKLNYRLEGSSAPDAPLIVLINSILTTPKIWDDFLINFFQNPDNRKYRVVRYESRGRTSDVGSTPVTVDLLASDTIALLDALRVPKAACVMGVSLGGATALCAGLKYRNRVASFVSCDTSSKSPEGNSKAWGERIAIAEGEGMRTQTGEAIVGSKLAEVTTKRWFTPASYDGAELEAKLWKVNDMVRENSLEGFKKSVEALWEYDLRPEMETFDGRGMFLVGAQDGVLPKSMKAMSESLKGSSLVVVEGAGHLPMVEKPAEVSAALGEFLKAA